jgi:hypothetical protein
MRQGADWSSQSQRASQSGGGMLACDNVVGLAPIELNEVDVGLGERQPAIRRHCNTQPPSTGAKCIVVNPHLGGRNLEVNGSGCEVSAVNVCVAQGAR